MATLKQIQEKIAQAPKAVVGTVWSMQKNATYATLGALNTAYAFGVERISSASERAKSDVEDYIKRGEAVEDALVGKFDAFKGSDNPVAKGVVTAEKQLKTLAESTEEQYKKVSGQVVELTDKIKTRLGKAKPAAKKKAVRKSAPKAKAKAKKAPVKKAPSKKAA